VNINNSERLNFKLMGAKDAMLLFELDQDAAVMKYINGGKLTSMKEIKEVYIPRMAEYTRAEKGWGLWQVNVTNTQEFIGWILVRPMHFFSEQPQWNNWELGWRFKQASWGKGYATEAAKQIMNTLASTQSVKYFSAIAVPDNLASINIMKKLGMQYLKTDLHQDPLGDMKVVYYQVSNCL